MIGELKGADRILSIGFRMHGGKFSSWMPNPSHQIM